MKKLIAIFCLFSLTIALVSTTLLPKKNSINAILITNNKTFVAGNPIQLKFKTTNIDNIPKLFIIHSYGKTFIEGTLSKKEITYIIPENFSNKTGLVSWFLVSTDLEKLSGNFEIIPNNASKTKIETYLDPPSMLAGDAHFVMLVVTPTDVYDNPKPENTAVLIKNQFLNSINQDIQKTKNFVSWQKIFSKNKSGKILVSAQCNQTVSKEFEAVVYPSVASNFTITYTRNHEYADGNQMTTLSSSIVKDKFGNTVSDGTLVTYIITTQSKMILKAFGTTINGLATAQILHPDHQDLYSVKAYITGVAESNTLSINYKSINPEINYSFSSDNRTISVGPLKSFMNQLVPDGIKVVLKIYHNTILIDTLQEDSSKGKAVFKLSEEFYKEKNYQFEISTLGKSIKTETKNYVINKQ